MKEIKLEILWLKHNRDFTTEIATHYTTVDRLCSGEDEFKYNDVEVIAKRQFIGIFDNEYNEIYCGDIISDHVGVGIVVWNDENCSFKVSYRNKNNGLGKWFCDYTDNELKSILVTGNIYQNPDLLLGGAK